MSDALSGRPEPYAGNYTYQLSARMSRSSAVSTFVFSCPVSAEATEVHLSGYFNSKGMRKQRANHLKIGWHPKGSDSWESFEYEISVEDVWSPFTLKIDPSAELEFSFEGTAQSGSILALDELKVEQIVATPIRTSEIGRAPVITAIYSLSGQKRDRLEKGINIVRYSDGTVKKLTTR